MAKRFDRLGWAMEQPDLTSPQKFVLVVLSDAANEADGECWLKYATIAERTSLGVTTVRDAVRHLIEVGLLHSSVRYDKRGRQTSNLYQLGCYGSVAEGVGSRHPESDEGVDTRQGEVSAPDTSTRTNQKQPPNKVKNNKTTTSTRSSSPRRAPRARDAEFTDPVDTVDFGDDDHRESENASVVSIRRHGADSAWGINKYYRDQVQVHGNGFVGSTNDAVMRRFFAEAKRQGLTPDTLRSMIDEFVTDKALFTRAVGARWRVFIANAAALQAKAMKLKGYAKRGSKPSEVHGAIPQHILDELLAEEG